MVFSKPFGEVEIEYIGNHYPQMNCREIAEKLGRSEQGVRNVVNRLGLTQSCARAKQAPDAGRTEPASGGDSAQDELAELRELKRILKRSMREDAGPQSLPRLSAEFRETVKRISELEGGEDADGEFPAAGGSVLVVPLRPA